MTNWLCVKSCVHCTVDDDYCLFPRVYAIRMLFAISDSIEPTRTCNCIE